VPPPAVHRAEAWAAAARGDLGDARAHLRTGAAQAADHGETAVAVPLLHDAVRLGDTSVAGRLVEMAAGCDSRLVAARAAYAQGVTTRDAARPGPRSWRTRCDRPPDPG